MKLVSIGEATADFYPQHQQTYVGGISLNFAVHAKRCGADFVSLVSCVGDDAHGQMILSRLDQEHINRSHVTVHSGKTAYCEIVILENGERYFPPNSYHQHVLATYEPSPVDLNFIQQHDILVSRFDISYTKATFDHVMKQMPFAGKRVADFGDWYDYAGREAQILPYLPHIDLAFVSGEPETINYFLPHSHGKTQWVITLGAEGSVALQNGKVIRQTAVSVPQIIDTTGCGDAFQAAFTVNYFQTSTLAQALNAGANHATQTLTHLGAI